MRVLFTTFGSYGDIHPYLAIGRELRKLGHQAALATSGHYRDKTEQAGLTFCPVRPDVTLENPEMMRYFFDRFRGTERVIKAMASVIRETYEDTLAAARGYDAIVTHPLSFAAVLAAEKLRLPWISTVLAPASFLSAHDPPIPTPFPRIVRRLLLLASRGWTRPVAQLRREIGLAAGGNPLLEGAHSLDLILALFSRVFAAPQRDWPEQAVMTGFPFYDDAGAGLAPELAAFLDAGPPPVVFTLGSSAVMAAGDFYSASFEAVDRVNARAVFLTGPFPQMLPQRLPDSVFAWPYAPHEKIFPRASAIVHQGGIGTTAQALRSGRPMLAAPFAHDQFDNAEHVRRLGVGLAIMRGKYNERTAAQALGRLLAEPSFEQSAKGIGERIRAENGARAAAEQIHRYLINRKISNTGRPLESKTV